MAARLAVMAALGLGLAGCGSSAGTGGAPAPAGTTSTGTPNWSALLGGQTQQPAPAATPAGAPGATEFDPRTYGCPKIEIRGGAAVWQVNDKSDGGLRYQATIVQTARDCMFARPDMTMKIGIQGRVLLGPKGGPGALTIPLRIAVVEEGPTPKTVWTKLYTAQVQVPPNELQVDFNIVAADVTFPLPDPKVLERYVVYLGFDSQAGAAAEARSKPAAKPRAPKPAAPRKPKPAAAPVSEPDSEPTASEPPAVSAPAAAPAAPAPAATQPAQSAPAQQWIGAPAPATGGFN
ncbi:hypothetical protein MWN34_19230 [Ancylobacter sp. 6x-1]|uniref:DUF4232 domain-containing protein n=1 Tax=Ancylobacter crimeensis TaxID=2579147 RepID=A0ABT0DGZ9_9HYPH|nr:hypothetical protein [Ancylobacter crimeensis]MCK0199037.1 hypothetical protein [Ancylobacter crimeensis]